MEKDELHKAFLSDLSALLKKYDAELNKELRNKGWYGEDVSVIDFNGIYEGENQRTYSQLDLPNYLD